MTLKPQMTQMTQMTQISQISQMKDLICCLSAVICDICG